MKIVRKRAGAALRLRGPLVVLFLGALLVAALGEVSLQVSSAQSGPPGIKEDMGIYPEPSPRPALPSPGGKLTDPTFGTEILRVTGPSDCFDPGCGTYYSHWPTFNLDNTKLLIRSGETGHAIIKDFNPATFTVSAGKTDLPITIQNSNCTNCPAGTYTGPTWESATWSNVYPNIIFTYPSWYHSGGALQLYSYDIQTAQFTLVADLNSAGGGNPAIARLQQMYMSANDDIFCWLQKRQGFTDAWGFTVYKRSTNQILFNEPDVYDGEINEVHVDKSGKWLHVVIPTAQPDGTGTRILNLQTGQYQPMVHSVDRTPGHGDMGTETIVGVNIYEAGLTARHLSDVHSFQQIFNYKTIEGNSDWTKDLHGSLLANDEGWITIGTYVDWDAIAGGLTNYHLMDNEIAQIATDGTGRVRRLAHTHSIIAADEAPGQTLSGIAPKPSNGYTAMPKPTISKDGKYIAFTSNWGNSDRYDLFILKVPPPAGNSLSLDGTNDYVLVNDSASLDVAGPVTVEAWFKLDSVGSYETIVSKEAFQVSGSGGGYELQVTNTGKLRGNFYQSHNTYTVTQGTTTVTPGVWHHAAVTYDGTTRRIFLDGVLEASVTGASAGPTAGTGNLRIGRRNSNTNSYHFDGLIDEVRVSNAALYSANFSPETNLTSTAGTTKGLWTFGGETVNDSSGNANHGTLQGGAAYSTDVPMVSSYSLSLDGTNDYVLVNDSASLDVAGPVTVEAWFKVDSIGNYQTIVSKEAFQVSGTGGGYELQVTNTGKVRGNFYQSHNTYTVTQGTTTVTPGVWHHAAVTYDGTTRRVFLDGVLEASVTGASAGPTAGTGNLRIGRRNNNTNTYYLDGLVDEVRVSDAALYTTGFTPQTGLTAGASTKGLWRFNAQTAADSSGNGNNGTLQGGTAFSTDVP